MIGVIDDVMMTSAMLVNLTTLIVLMRMMTTEVRSRLTMIMTFLVLLTTVIMMR